MKRLREHYPRWGKEKLTRLLPSELATWVSTVGRILSYLRRRGVLIEPQSRRRAANRSRSSRPYAIRKPKDYVAQQPGDLVQVDTLDIRPVPGVVLKQFTASDVVSRFDVLEVHRRATASLASQFVLCRLMEVASSTLSSKRPVPRRASSSSSCHPEALGYLTPAQFISNCRAEHPANEVKGTVKSIPTVPSLP